MKNVLLLVHADAGQEARLQAALAIVRAFGGHLDCVDVTGFPRVFDGGVGMIPVVIDEAEQEERNKETLQRRLDAEKVPWSWTDRVGEFAPAVVEAARTADAIVLNRKFSRHGGPDMRAIVSAVLTHSQALVIAVGEDCPGLHVEGPALIAWDGSQPAWHAVRRALPFLQRASKVTIFQSGPVPPGAISAEEAALYLSRHGIEAQVEKGSNDSEPGIAIGRAARRLQAAYCVMGAFGHSRLNEALLGGVTRAMLTGAPLPLLLAH